MDQSDEKTQRQTRTPTPGHLRDLDPCALDYPGVELIQPGRPGPAEESVSFTTKAV